jgi:hypothetical protein
MKIHQQERTTPMRTKKWKAALLSLTMLAVTPMQTEAQELRNIGEYNLQDGVGSKGYDPVAVFPEHGSRARVGDGRIRLTHLGVTYLFSTAGNLETFAENPSRYEPSYGGWCAYAMSFGRKVNIQPHLFTIHGNRAHFFASVNAKANFDMDIPGFEERSDRFWKEISGEDPRL